MDSSVVWLKGARSLEQFPRLLVPEIARRIASSQSEPELNHYQGIVWYTLNMILPNTDIGIHFFTLVNSR